jgi:hypothetical protein
MFIVLFYLLLVLLVFSRYCLDTMIYSNLQDLKEQDSEQQQLERGKCYLTMLMLCSFYL